MIFLHNCIIQKKCLKGSYVMPTLDSYVEEVKFKLTGGIIELEIDDAAIQKTIEHGFRELQRYIDQPKLKTVPFRSCIDVKDLHCSEIKYVYVADSGYGVSQIDTGSSTAGTRYDANGNVSIYANTPIDPIQWNAIYLGGNGQISNWTNYVDNYYTYTQVKKSLNTGDLKRLVFTYNKQSEKLYINSNVGCSAVTIEYIPRFDNVEDITNDAWIDILTRLSVANLKIALGRVRTRFTQSNALWTQDGESLLNEGNTELTELRTYLDASASKLRPR